MKRTSKDVAWSTISQGLICLHCGQPAIDAGGEIICVNDPDCLAAMREDAEKDCAPEGHTYAVYGSDQ